MNVMTIWGSLLFYAFKVASRTSQLRFLLLLIRRSFHAVRSQLMHSKFYLPLFMFSMFNGQVILRHFINFLKTSFFASKTQLPRRLMLSCQSWMRLFKQCIDWSVCIVIFLSHVFFFFLLANILYLICFLLPYITFTYSYCLLFG